MSNDIFSTQVQDDVLNDVLLEDDSDELDSDALDSEDSDVFGEVDPDLGDSADEIAEEENMDDEEDSEF